MLPKRRPAQRRAQPKQGSVMTVLLIIFAAIAVFWILAYYRLPAIAWTVVIAIGLALITVYMRAPHWLIVTLWVAFIVAALLDNPTPLRRALISRPMLDIFRKILPQMSQTEREAIDAGTVWWDARAVLRQARTGTSCSRIPAPTLSRRGAGLPRRRRSRSCARCSTTGRSRTSCHDLPPQVWQYIKDKGFLGMIIPKEYGGLGFSALRAFAGGDEARRRAAARAAVTVMVPNSLGPAELLLHYGTDEQKNHYLPRLAKGLEIPCFALTSPEAGSDAAAIPDFGVVCKGEYEGKRTCSACASPGTSATSRSGPVATLLGLAFRALRPGASARRQGRPRHHLRADPDRRIRA